MFGASNSSNTHSPECEKKQAYQVVIVLVFEKIVRDLYTNHEVYKKKSKKKIAIPHCSRHFQLRIRSCY